MLLTMKISERKLTRVSLFRYVCVGKNMKNSINLRVFFQNGNHSMRSRFDQIYCLIIILWWGKILYVKHIYQARTGWKNQEIKQSHKNQHRRRRILKDTLVLLKKETEKKQIVRVKNTLSPEGYQREPARSTDVNMIGVMDLISIANSFTC